MDQEKKEHIGMVPPSRAEYDQETFNELIEQFEGLQRDIKFYKENIDKYKSIFKEMHDNGIQIDSNVFENEGRRILFSVTQPTGSIDNQPKLLIKRMI